MLPLDLESSSTPWTMDEGRFIRLRKRAAACMSRKQMAVLASAFILLVVCATIFFGSRDPCWQLGRSLTTESCKVGDSGPSPSKKTKVQASSTDDLPISGLMTFDGATTEYVQGKVMVVLFRAGEEAVTSIIDRRQTDDGWYEEQARRFWQTTYPNNTEELQFVYVHQEGEILHGHIKLYTPHLADKVEWICVGLGHLVFFEVKARYSKSQYDDFNSIRYRGFVHQTTENNYKKLLEGGLIENVGLSAGHEIKFPEFVVHAIPNDPPLDVAIFAEFDVEGVELSVDEKATKDDEGVELSVDEKATKDWLKIAISVKVQMRSKSKINKGTRYDVLNACTDPGKVANLLDSLDWATAEQDSAITPGGSFPHGKQVVSMWEESLTAANNMIKEPPNVEDAVRDVVAVCVFIRRRHKVSFATARDFAKMYLRSRAANGSVPLPSEVNAGRAIKNLKDLAVGRAVHGLKAYNSLQDLRKKYVY